jgi:hypothetical protein
MDRVEKIKTVSVLGVAFLVLFFIFKVNWLAIIAMILFILAITEGPVTDFIAKYWMKFARVLGTFNAKVILTLVYYLILTPLACLYRLANKELLDHYKNKKSNSYYKDYTSDINAEFFERIW